MSDLPSVFTCFHFDTPLKFLSAKIILLTWTVFISTSFWKAVVSFSFSILKVVFHCLLTFFYCWEIASYSNCLWVICLFSLVALISTLWCCTLSLWCVAFCYFIILGFSEPGDWCLSSVLENSQPFYPNNVSSQFL